MSKAPLTTGTYYIRNEELFAGRNLKEDKSLLPKGVYCPTDEPEAQLVSILWPRLTLFKPLSVES